MAFCLLFGLWTQTASAHTLYIKPDPVPASDGSIGAVVNNGTFDTNESPLQAKWIARQGVINPDGSISQTSEFEAETGFLPPRITFRPPSTGTYLLELATKTRMARQNATQFERYLGEEGIKDAKAERVDLNEMGVAVAERYTKWAKAILVVGDGMTGQFDVPLGHRLEFVALTHPDSVSPGEAFSALLLVDGQPAANRLVHAGTSDNEFELRSNAQGLVYIPISKTGKWYIKYIELVRSGDQEYWYSPILVWLGQDERRIPYESNWATLSFDIR
jgi:hypothetical protein